MVVYRCIMGAHRCKYGLKGRIKGYIPGVPYDAVMLTHGSSTYCFSVEPSGVKMVWHSFIDAPLRLSMFHSPVMFTLYISIIDAAGEA